MNKMHSAPGTNGITMTKIYHSLVRYTRVKKSRKRVYWNIYLNAAFFGINLGLYFFLGWNWWNLAAVVFSGGAVWWFFKKLDNDPYFQYDEEID